MKIVLCLLIGVFCLHVSAQYPANQKAGELSYQLVDNGGDNPPPYYHFILKMVVDCSESAAPNTLFINDHSANTSAGYGWTFDSASNKVDVVDPCITFSKSPCYRVFYFHVDITLGYNRGGYSAFYPDCCRDYYQNIRSTFNASIYEGTQLGLGWSAMDVSRPGSGYIYNGIVYFESIPSRFVIKNNSSPVFDNTNDTVLYVCTNTDFSHVFKATDPDGDSLVYSFTPAKTFFATGSNGMVTIQTTGNTQNITYIAPTYTPTQPLGPDVTIDPFTGAVKGQLHDTGSYLLTIGVDQYRNGQLVTTIPHTRDVVIKAFDCSKIPPPKAIIPPLINSCNTKTVILPDSTTPYHPDLYWDNIKYLWDLGDGDTAQTRYPVHTYDTGTYKIRLITMAGYRCADTAYSTLLVYPSVHPSFVINGLGCINQPIQFTNTSTTDEGMINNLEWTFINGKDSTRSSTALNNPTHIFTVPDQTYAAILAVTTTKGCEARDTQYINTRQSPYPLITHDTILSAGEPWQLHANSGYDSIGSFVWTPAFGLDNPNSANPVATGTEDITYKVQIQNSYGCSLSDTVHIKYYKGPDIYVPNAFTPNGDGRNDIFRPFPVGIVKLDYFRVFNRWGGIMYQTQAYLQGWDGRVGGQPALPGTYIWEVRGKDYKNTVIFKRGTVLLIR